MPTHFPARKEARPQALETLLRLTSYLPVTFVSVIYAAGFIVVTNVFSRWRIPAFDLVRGRYLTAGLDYLVISASAILLTFLAINSIAGLWNFIEGLIRKSSGKVITFKELIMRWFLFFAVAALLVFPISVIFFSKPPLSAHVYEFLIGRYAIIIPVLGLIRLMHGYVERVTVNNMRLHFVMLIEIVSWAALIGLWFLGTKVLVFLHIPFILMEVGIFYFFFIVLLTVFVIFLFNPYYQRFAIRTMGYKVFWTVQPVGMFIVAYITIIAFAISVYPNIPAQRGGGAPICVDIEVAKFATSNEVVDRQERAYKWWKNLVLLDDRDNVMYLTHELKADGSANEILVIRRSLVRAIHYVPEQPIAKVEFGDDFKQRLSADYWQRLNDVRKALPKLDKSCDQSLTGMSMFNSAFN